MSTNRSISTLTIINLLSALFGIAYSIIQARIFGVSRTIEVFFATQVIIQTMIKMTQSSMISAVFMPYYHKFKEEKGQKFAQQAYSVIINWMFLFAVGVSLILWVLSSFIVPLILRGYDPQYQILGLDMFRILILLIPFQVIISLFNLPFNAEKKFGRQEIISSMNSLIYIITLLVSYKYWGAFSLVAALVAGVFIQSLAYLFLLRRIKFNYSFRLGISGFSHWQVFSKMSNTISYTTSHQIYANVLTSACSYLPEGYYAAFRYVQNLYSRTNVILLRPISTVFFTEFSEAASKKKATSVLKGIIKSAASKSFAFSFTCAILVIVSGEVVLSFLWGSDKFGPEYIQLCYYLMIVFFGLLIFPALNQVYNKVNITHGFVRDQYLGASLVQLISALMAHLLIPELGFMALLIILGVNLVMKLLNSLRIIYFKNRELLYLIELKSFAKWLFVMLVSISTTLYLFHVIDLQTGVSRSYDFIHLSLRCAFALLITFVTGSLLRIVEFTWLLSFLRKKIKIG